MNATITLAEYLAKGKTFVVPAYQRGYVWGKHRIGEKDSVSYLIDDIVMRFVNETDLFLQGVTVQETEREIVLIDGQQRTTCLYLLLKWLGYDGKFELRYEVRKASGDFLKNLNLNDTVEKDDEEYQDVFFFKRTLRIINEKLINIDSEKLLNFMLHRIKFLYIHIEGDPVRVFTMMNGSKAEMFQEEIVKAEMLRLVSKSGQGDTIDQAVEWEHHLTRSRYAREWDRWLHWWNREEVKRLYICHAPMGLLITSYYGKPLTFEGFRNRFFGQQTPMEAKKCFDDLRRLEKRFEDAYNAFDDAETHNMVGAILRIFDYENRQKFIRHYFVDDRRSGLKDYYLKAFLGMTHDEILSGSKLQDKYDDTLAAIGNDYAYTDDKCKEKVFRLLLRLNVDQDSLLNRRFDFSIWENRSLEHIHSKSKVLHETDGKWYNGNDEVVYLDGTTWKYEKDGKTLADDAQMLYRDNIKTKAGERSSEHGIGNLVLLYGNENSQFRNSNFERKKVLFFSPQKQDLFRSRHLLHTICVFAEKTEWNGESIVENKLKTIEKFKADYKDFI